MSVKVLLDKPHSHFTNLDFISGRIILNLSNDEAISSITVKLEGESKTRLAGPKSLHNDGQGGRKTELEIHKVSKCFLCMAAQAGIGTCNLSSSP